MNRTTKQRLNQLAKALDEIGNMKAASVQDALRRALRLLELCPWIEADDPPAVSPAIEEEI